jgi:hypothetical protein
MPMLNGDVAKEERPTASSEFTMKFSNKCPAVGIEPCSFFCRVVSYFTRAASMPPFFSTGSKADCERETPRVGLPGQNDSFKLLLALPGLCNTPFILLLVLGSLEKVFLSCSAINFWISERDGPFSRGEASDRCCISSSRVAIEPSLLNLFGMGEFLSSLDIDCPPPSSEAVD